MFARITSVVVFLFFALPLLAAASAVPRGGSPPPASSCTTGPVQCCNSVQAANNLSNPVTLLLGLLGVVVGSLTGQVGVTCSPISVIGIGGNSCSAQAVCCSNNSFNGLVALGCSPVNLSL
ncbi:fungal hydrophobin-domain-containing protein [Crucibulum laeve]|uniref:Hydrophobin n=1 Tax=Crucibulum laeve TaxID=68775 RepID=A0A5C3LWZ2_9AGAR|nr:fungal hydrophobin-domain-containing protein [Crucibulum laeve]